jgi:hypothetical protein
MKFPLSIGVFVAGFSAFGCGVSDAEVPSPDFWKDAAVIETDAAVAPDSSTAADGGSEDGSIYGNDASAAGAGGDHHQAGSGGAGGNTEPEGGSGGTGGDEEPVGGSGGAGGDEEPVGGSGGSGGSDPNVCPTEYTMATHIVMNVTWPKTEVKVGVIKVTVVPAGSGVVHLWSRSFFEEDGNTSGVRSKSCGSVLPPIKTSAAAGGENLLPQIPDGAWDQPTMPEFIGSATKTGNSVVASTGVALVGLTMDDPNATTWPARVNIGGVDHDSDGFAGLAAVPKTDGGYKALPLDLNRSARADRLDLAIRTVMTLNSTVEGCPEDYEGTANVTKFQNHIIGCHVQGGGECDDTQKSFVDNNRTVYTVTSATFTAKRVDDDASCAEVRAALPIQ